MRSRTIRIVTLLLAAAVGAVGQSSFTPPILLTSAGQSADVTMAGMLCKKAGLEAKALPRATASDLAGVKTLVIVPGFSSKGLGAAGISREQEMKRVREIIAAAGEKKIPILMMHLGGKPRRGAQSDDFNKIVGEASRRMIVVKQGDEDGFFSAIAQEKKIPIDVVEKIAESMKPLAAAFQ